MVIWKYVTYCIFTWWFMLKQNIQWTSEWAEVNVQWVASQQWENRLWKWLSIEEDHILNSLFNVFIEPLWDNQWGIYMNSGLSKLTLSWNWHVHDLSWAGRVKELWRPHRSTAAPHICCWGWRRTARRTCKDSVAWQLDCLVFLQWLQTIFTFCNVHIILRIRLLNVATGSFVGRSPFRHCCW